MHPLVRLLVLALLATLPGCSKTPSWFRGKFVFDQDTTVEQIHAATQKKKDGLAALLGSITAAMAPVLIQEQWSKTSLTVTDTEFVTLKDGAGEALKYEVFDQTDPNSVTIKFPSTGKMETWRKTESGIARPAENAPELMLHFRRAE